MGVARRSIEKEIEEVVKGCRRQRLETSFRRLRGPECGEVPLAPPASSHNRRLRRVSEEHAKISLSTCGSARALQCSGRNEHAYHRL